MENRCGEDNERCADFITRHALDGVVIYAIEISSYNLLILARLWAIWMF
jgi:hypothetical protein